MNVILFDDQRIQHFLPLTHTRPLSALRCGILTMKERWDFVLQASCYVKTSEHLREKFPFRVSEDNLLINSAVLPSPDLMKAIQVLEPGSAVIKGEVVIAVRLAETEARLFDGQVLPEAIKQVELPNEVLQLQHPWDLFTLNDRVLREDYQLLTRGRISASISSTNRIIGSDVFIEEGARVECSMLNASTGPIYIARNAEVMEGCMIRGPFALGEGAVLKMGAKIYGATTIGEGCKVGGEVNNSIFLANANKAHDGFIGNAVIGEWCNIGADSNNSNLKNNYEEVRLWSEYKQTFVRTGLQFCGLIMGDHSKLGINTMINTGTVIGVSCNVFGAGFPRNFIPSFSWGSAAGFTEYQLKKAIDTASRVYQRRNLPFDAIEQQIFQHVFETTNSQRNY